MFLPWAAYLYRKEDMSAAEAYLQNLGKRLDPRARAWIQAHIDAPYSIFEILAVTADEGLQVRYMLTGRSFFVTEKAANHAIQPADAILAKRLSLMDCIL